MGDATSLSTIEGFVKSVHSEVPPTIAKAGDGAFMTLVKTRIGCFLRHEAPGGKESDATSLVGPAAVLAKFDFLATMANIGQAKGKIKAAEKLPMVEVSKLLAFSWLLDEEKIQTLKEWKSVLMSKAGGASVYEAKRARTTTSGQDAKSAVAALFVKKTKP